jgi:hypothetical protein
VREVKAQVIGRHQRAGLGHVRAEHPAQRGVEQVRAGVVLTQTQAARRLDGHRHILVFVESTRLHAHPVDDELGAAVVGVRDLASSLPSDQRAGVT